jgi:hypothetical protein
VNVALKTGYHLCCEVIKRKEPIRMLSCVLTFHQGTLNKMPYFNLVKWQGDIDMNLFLFGESTKINEAGLKS